MTDQLALPTEGAELEGFTGEALVEHYMPRIESALAKAESPEEVNEIRAQIEAVSTYVNRKVQTEAKDKKQAVQKANRMNKAYLEACRRAGEFWLVAEKYEGRPPEKASENVRFLTAEEAGFASRQDAHRCAKVAQLHDEDVRTYFEEKDKNGEQYTLGGLVHAYNVLNPKDEEEGDKVQFSTRTIRKRIDSCATKLNNLKDELEGEAYDKVDEAVILLWDSLDLLTKQIEDEEEANG